MDDFLSSFSIVGHSPWTTFRSMAAGHPNQYCKSVGRRIHHSECCLRLSRRIWRAFFSPMFCYSFAVAVNTGAESVNLTQRVRPGPIAMIYVGLLLLNGLPDPYWLICLLAHGLNWLDPSGVKQGAASDDRKRLARQLRQIADVIETDGDSQTEPPA